MNPPTILGSPADPALPPLPPAVEEAALALANAEFEWRQAGDALKRANASRNDARITVLRAQTGGQPPVDPGALKQAQRTIFESAHTLKQLETAHGAAYQEYLKARARFTSLLPQPPQDEAIAAIRKMGGGGIRYVALG